MPEIAHIINPVNASKSSDLFIAQPITFQTMLTAKDKASAAGIQVRQFAACHPDEDWITPPDFIQTPPLERTVMDILVQRNLRTISPDLRLPLIGDILDRLHTASDAGYFIYTNVDIALQPDFYIAVQRLIRQGYDAFIINRRTISKRFEHLDQIPDMYKETGTKHPGQDCFVFRRSALPRYMFYSVCIGSSGIGKAFAMNMMAHAGNFKLFTDLHLTFHIGEDRAWKKPEMIDYRNIREVHKIMKYYQKMGVEFSHPIIEHFMKRFQLQA